MKIASIVGARPEFVQAAVVSTVLREHHQEVLVHTGQHYDDLMSDIFFRDLKLPVPDINLNIGSKSASAQTGEMLMRLEPVLADLDPDLVIVRGDTNSTLAGALAAKQGLFPIAHIEAGMRSFDLTMPEEQNRVVTDHLADALFAVDEEGESQLRSEGVQGEVFVVGDVLYDTYFKVRGALPPDKDGFLGHGVGKYDLLTIHRGENADDPARLGSLFKGFEGAPRPVLFPMHPRTKKRIAEFGISLPASIEIHEPFGYLEMLAAERRANRIFTDSGGVQREAYYAGVPCVTLRETTEWTNTVRAGWNTLAGASTENIRRALRCSHDTSKPHPLLFGDGNASAKIARILESQPVQKVISARRKLRESRRS